MTQISLEKRLRIFNLEGFVKILDSSKLLKIVLYGIFYFCVCIEVIGAHAILQLVNCGK